VAEELIECMAQADDHCEWPSAATGLPIG